MCVCVSPTQNLHLQNTPLEHQPWYHGHFLSTKNLKMQVPSKHCSTVYGYVIIQSHGETMFDTLSECIYHSIL